MASPRETSAAIGVYRMCYADLIIARKSNFQFFVHAAMGDRPLPLDTDLRDTVSPGGAALVAVVGLRRVRNRFEVRFKKVAR